jgi:hypothetical protein
MARLWHRSYCAIWWVSVILASLLEVLPVAFFVIAWSIYQFLRAGCFGVRTPGEAKWFPLLHTRPDRPCGPNSPVNKRNRSSGWGVALTTPPPSSPAVKNQYSCTCVPLSLCQHGTLPLPVTSSVNLSFWLQHYIYLWNSPLPSCKTPSVFLVPGTTLLIYLHNYSGSKFINILAGKPYDSRPLGDIILGARL